MGQIRRHSLINNVLTYGGFIIGAFNLLVLFNIFLSEEEIGLTRVFFSLASIISQFSMLSMNAVAVRFFPYFKGHLKSNENDFLRIFVNRTLFGFLIMLSLGLLLENQVIDYFEARSALVGDYFHSILIFSFFYVLFNVLDNYALVNHLSIHSSAVREVLTRVLTSLIVVLYFGLNLNFSQFIVLYSCLYVLPSAYLIWVLVKHGSFSYPRVRSLLSKRLQKPINLYSVYMYSGLMIAIVAAQVDSIFIAGMLGLGSTTIFLYAEYFSTLILVPYRSFVNVISPIFAESWRLKDYEKLKTVYQSSALNQLLAGLFIFGMLWINIDFISRIINFNFSVGIEAMFFLSVARILDISFGLNSELLTTSKSWKFNFYSYIGFLVIFLPTNYYLIKQYGITGAAISNLLTYLCLNLSRYIYILKNFNIQPFTNKTLYIILIFLGAFSISYLVKIENHMFLSLSIKSATFALIYIVATFYFKISNDLSTLAKQAIQKYSK